MRSEREYTVRWRASALHCVHDDAELPIERAGDLVVVATRPALALREAKRHALAQLPTGDDWRREAQVALTIDGIELGWGHATRVRGGERPL